MKGANFIIDRLVLDRSINPPAPIRWMLQKVNSGVTFMHKAPRKIVSLMTVLLFVLALNADSPANKAPLPKRVDLRQELLKYGLGPRNQGARPTCSVFVTTGALEFALSKQLGQGTPLSVEYLNWAGNKTLNRNQDNGHFFHDALKGYEKFGVCPESQMPYQGKYDQANQPSPVARDLAREVLASDLQIHWINPWKKDPGLTDLQMREIKEVLAKGWPVAAGSSHSRLLVGYVDDNRQAGGGYFLTKDSGNGSFDRISYKFAQTNVGDVFWVEGKPSPSPKKP